LVLGADEVGEEFATLLLAIGAELRFVRLISESCGA